MEQKINVIILAAGRSERMGSPKPLLPFQGTTLLEFQVSSVTNMGMIPIVVLGFHRQEILSTLPDLAKNSFIAINSEPGRGQFSSLKTGLLYTGPNSVFVLPIDTPAPQPGVWNALLEQSKDHWVAIPKFKNRGGHPVWLSPDFCAHLHCTQFSPTEERLDVQIKLLDSKLVTQVELNDSSILTDLDSPEDMIQFLNH